MRAARARRQHWLDEREIARMTHDRERERRANALIAECEQSIVALERQLILVGQSTLIQSARA